MSILDEQDPFERLLSLHEKENERRASAELIVPPSYQSKQKTFDSDVTKLTEKQARQLAEEDAERIGEGNDPV